MLRTVYQVNTHFSFLIVEDKPCNRAKNFLSLYHTLLTSEVSPGSPDIAKILMVKERIDAVKVRDDILPDQFECDTDGEKFVEVQVKLKTNYSV